MVFRVITEFDQLFPLPGRNGLRSTVPSHVIQKVKLPIIPIVIRDTQQLLRKRFDRNRILPNPIHLFVILHVAAPRYRLRGNYNPVNNPVTKNWRNGENM